MNIFISDLVVLNQIYKFVKTHITVYLKTIFRYIFNSAKENLFWGKNGYTTLSYTDLTKTRSCLFQNLLPCVTERHPCRVQNACMKQKSPFSRGGCAQTSHLSIEVPSRSQVVLILFFPAFTPLLDLLTYSNPRPTPRHSVCSRRAGSYFYRHTTNFPYVVSLQKQTYLASQMHSLLCGQVR